MQTLQFAWFVGHFILLLSIVHYSLSYITFNSYSPRAQFSYRTAFLSAAVTYGIVVYKAYRAKARNGRGQVGLKELAGDENVQYLAMALVWLYSRQVPLALLPFGIYSVFHYASYVRQVVIPTIQPPQQITPPTGTSPSAKPQYKTSPIADKLGAFVKNNYDFSMYMVATLEVGLWIRLFLSVLIFQKNAWVLILIYTAFLRARYAQSNFVQKTVTHLRVRVDNLLAGQSIPPVTRQVWEAIKQGIARFGDLTDFGRPAGSAGPGPKKAQ